MKKTACRCTDYGFCNSRRYNVSLNQWLKCQRRSSIERLCCNSEFEERQAVQPDVMQIDYDDFAVELEGIEFVDADFYPTIFTRKISTHIDSIKAMLASSGIKYGRLVTYPVERWFSNFPSCNEEELYYQNLEISNFFSQLSDKVIIVRSCGIAYLINKETGKRTICLSKGTIYE